MIDTIYSDPDFLEHHGVKGMKWGVRKDKNHLSFLNRLNGDDYGTNKDSIRYAEKTANLYTKREEYYKTAKKGKKVNGKSIGIPMVDGDIKKYSELKEAKEALNNERNALLKRYGSIDTIPMEYVQGGKASVRIILHNKRTSGMHISDIEAYDVDYRLFDSLYYVPGVDD